MDLKLSAGDATFSVRVHLEEVFVQQGDESRTYAV